MLWLRLTARLCHLSGKVMLAISGTIDPQIESPKTKRTSRLKKSPTPLLLIKIVVVVTTIASQIKSLVRIAKNYIICGDLRKLNP